VAVGATHHLLMDAHRAADGTVVVTFPYPEAVVLSDLLSRWDLATDRTIEHPAETRVLDGLTAVFEPLIDEVFSSDYGQVRDDARKAVAGSTEP
jgi:hypothetical protein